MQTKSASKLAKATRPTSHYYHEANLSPSVRVAREHSGGHESARRTIIIICRRHLRKMLILPSRIVSLVLVD